MKNKRLFIIASVSIICSTCGLISCQRRNNSSSSYTSSISTSDFESSETSISIDIDEYEIEWDESQDYLRNGNRKLSFYNVNDIHGAVDEDGEKAGIRKISSYLKKQKSLNPEGFVFTSTGDTWQGSADSNLTKGAIMNSWLEYLGCSAMALGNHEFDWTISTLLENQEQTSFPFLACNIIDKESNKNVDWVQPYTTITRNGVHIGIIGAIGQGITTSILASNVKDLSFYDPLPFVMQWSTYLKNNGADVILFLYHYSTENLSTSYADYVDGIFGGHNHLYELNNINGVPAVEGGANGDGLSHIEMNYSFSSHSVSSSGDIIYSSSLIACQEDAGTEAIINSFSSQIAEIKNEKVAYIPHSIYGNDLVLQLEKYMYQFYYDEIGNPKRLYRVGHNQARSYLSSGYVTYGDIYSCFPFDNQLVLARCLLDKCDEYAYTSYYPNGEDPSSVSENGYVYILTIDYLSEHEIYGRYLTNVSVYNNLYPRDIMKKYLAEEYPII